MPFAIASRISANDISVYCFFDVQRPHDVPVEPRSRRSQGFTAGHGLERPV
jgi:hypothetical protein